MQGNNGVDGSFQTLGDCPREIEKGGTVDFNLGGHTHSRPAGVLAGQEDDKFPREN